MQERVVAIGLDGTNRTRQRKAVPYEAFEKDAHIVAEAMVGLA
jgi:hypothetical protein